MTTTTTILDVQTPVGRWVAERPARARVFERLGIDYCCGGRTPLAQACAARGLAVEEVLPELHADDVCVPDEPAVDWTEAPLRRLVEHIVTAHHGFLRRELPLLESLAARVAAAHGDRHPELWELRDVFLVFRGALEFHMLKEEEILFPMITLLGSSPGRPGFSSGRINQPILVMEREHEDAGAALERMRTLTGDYTPPADACPSYRALLSGLAELEADMHRHVHLENNILFPRALAAETARHGALTS